MKDDSIVLHVIGKPVHGGMERIVTAYRDLGVFTSLNLRVYLCTLSFSEKRELYGAKIDFPLGWKFFGWFFLNRKSLDIIHVHTIGSLLFFMPLSLFSNSKVIYHIHSWQQTRGLSLFVLKWFKWLNITVISVNSDISDLLNKTTGISIFTLYNFIGSLRGSYNITFKCLQGREVSLGYVGRFAQEKGVLNIIHQVRILESRGFRIKMLYLFGAGSLATRVVEMLKRDCKGLEVVYREDVFSQDLIYLFDILLLPSPEESFSLVMHEALIRGIRVLAASDRLIKTVPKFYRSANCISNVGDFNMGAISVDLELKYVEQFDFDHHIRSLEKIYGLILLR